MKNSILATSIALIILLLAACEAEVKQPTNRFEAAAFNTARPSSDVEQDNRRKAVKVLAFSQIEASMKVADIMAGSGYFSELYSYLVGSEGQVYLHNVPAKAEKLADKIEQRLANNRLSNVTSITANVEGLVLPEKVNLIILSKIYHDVYVKGSPAEQQAVAQKWMDSIKSNLLPGGKVLIIDHSAPLKTKTQLTAKTHRIAEDYVAEVFNENGFKLINSGDFLRNPNDDRKLNIWKKAIIKKTDQFIQLYQMQ